MALTDALGNLIDFPLLPGQAHDLQGTAVLIDGQLRLKFQVQHPRPLGHGKLRWTNDTSTSTARTVA